MTSGPDGANSRQDDATASRALGVGSVADFLDDHRDSIVECWLGEEQALVGEGGFSREDLIDSLPGFLEELSGALRREEGRFTTSLLPAHSVVSEAHGRQRMRLGIDASLVVREYALLRDCLLAAIDREGLVLTVAQTRLLSRCIDTGAAEAVAQYVAQAATQRAEADAARERLLQLFEHAPAIVCSTRGPEHIFEIANPLFRRSVGSGRRLLGLPVKVALPEVVPQGFIALLDEVYRSGQPFTGEDVRVRLDRRGDGNLEDVFISFVYQPRRNATGEVEGIDVFGFDVTEQVRSRLRAEEAFAELETVFQSVPDALYVGDMTGIRRANAPALSMLGYDSVADLNRAVGTLAEEIQTRRADTGEAISTEDQAFSRALQGTVDVQEVIVRHLTTGEDRIVRSSCAPIRVGGEVVGAVAINTDITESKAAEKALRDRTEFEQQLIGIVSHDLRNPLSTLTLGIQWLLRSEVLDDRSMKTAIRMQSAAERALRLIRDLLDFTQVRLAGGLTVSPEDMHLYEFTRRLIEELQMSYPERDIELRATDDGHGAWDPDRMSQLLTNLVQNALKYSPADTPVTVSLRSENDTVVLEVHNEGPAIPPVLIPRLFQPLQRGFGEGERGVRSVGLGLYIVDAVARAHGGRVEVRSADGDGTTFTVRLPRHPK